VEGSEVLTSRFQVSGVRFQEKKRFQVSGFRKGLGREQDENEFFLNEIPNCKRQITNKSQ
jgi:hypothetical protein